MSYALLKMIHIGSVVVSYTFFFVRGIWMMRDSPALQQRWVKVVPHIIDTILLTSAIALAITIQQFPLEHVWLTAKVIGLLCYIGLGMIALRFGKTRSVKISAWLAAQCVFAYIVLVAINKDPTIGM